MAKRYLKLKESIEFFDIFNGNERTQIFRSTYRKFLQSRVETGSREARFFPYGNVYTHSTYPSSHRMHRCIRNPSG